MSTTFERLCDVLVKRHKLPLEGLTPEAPLDSLGIDSLGAAELLWNVEDEFRIKLPVNPVELHTLGDVVTCVDQLLAAPGRAAIAAAPTRPIVPAS